MKIGIDQIGFYTPNKYLDMVDLAHARNQDPNKFLIGIGQNKMSVPDQSQDAVSMAINATEEYLDKIDQNKLGLLIFGTESSVDQSKSASLFVKSALKLPKQIRTFELKEACYGLTAALLMAKDYVQVHPDKTAIVIGSDIARYGLKTAGEVTQGAGAISMLISAEPHILELEDGSSTYSDDIDDFWRPNNFQTALVDGKYSTQVYLDFFTKTFADYQKTNNLEVKDFDALIYHLPFTKMGLKALRLALENQDPEVSAKLMQNFEASTKYSREVGNIYTASLYMALLSLLEKGHLTSGSRIGLFSYGSGAMGEFFAGKLVPGYKNYLHESSHQMLLSSRRRLDIPEYEDIFTKDLELLPENIEFKSDEKLGRWYFAGQENYIRKYNFKK